MPFLWLTVLTQEDWDETLHRDQARRPNSNLTHKIRSIEAAVFLSPERVVDSLASVKEKFARRPLDWTYLNNL